MSLISAAEMVDAAAHPHVGRPARQISVLVALSLIVLAVVIAAPADLVAAATIRSPLTALNFLSLGAIVAAIGMLRSRHGLISDRLSIQLATMMMLLGVFIAASVGAQAGGEDENLLLLLDAVRLGMIPCGLWMAIGRSHRALPFGRYFLFGALAIGLGMVTRALFELGDPGQMDVVIVFGLGLTATAIAVEGVREREPRRHLGMLILVCGTALDPTRWVGVDEVSADAPQQLFVLAFVGAVITGVFFDLRDATMAAHRMSTEAVLQANQTERLLLHQFDESVRLVHDSRNALLAIHGGLQALTVADHDKGLVASIDAELDRVQAMIEDSRSPRAPFVVEDALTPMIECYRSAGFQIETRIPAACVADGDDMLVGEIVQNLIENAIRHGGADVVDIEVTRTSKFVRIDVADRGPGLAVADPSVLFLPGVSDGVGEGVGLSISKRLAESLGGSLSASNRPGGGAVFRLELAAHQPTVVDLRKPEPEPNPKPERNRVETS